jgi:dTDP-4-amino-4,6-dideoxygalactose transaminase
VVSVLRGTRLSLGPKMEEFEELICRYTGQSFGIAVSSGTAGLHLCVRALGIGAGDEVVVPSFTFVAAANAVRYEGATPVFVDIEPRHSNLDPGLIEAVITPRTRAIIAVHTFGCPANMQAILEIAHRHGLRVIEDACEAIGATSQGRHVGCFGDAAVFAFYPNKQITTGEGGLVVTGDAHLAREIRAMRNHGRYESDEWHQHSILGYNYRLSEIHCALGCAQMRRLPEILAARERVARTYQALLGSVRALVLPPTDAAGTRISWFVYVVRLGEQFRQDQRNAIARKLQQRGVGCGRYFASIHMQPAYADLPLRQPLPVTESISRRTLALPFFTRLREEEMEQVAEALRESIEAVSR